MIDRIAERAAERAVEKVIDHMYREVGRNVLNKLAWLTGIVVVSVTLWLAGNGHLKGP